MTPKEKAIELLDKINNKPIDFDEWETVSKYAKNDLKRKALIVAEEIILNSNQLDDSMKTKFNRMWWKQVENEIKKL